MKPPEESLQGTIYSATQTCRKSLSECLELKELMQNEWAENRLADFNLWASGLGASIQGRASLDARLASRPDARDAVANLLQVLAGAMEDCKALVRGSAESTSVGCDEGHPTSDSEEDPPRSFSPWSDDSNSDSDLESTLNDSPLDKAKETVNSLLDLLVRIAITIRRSGTQSRLRKADRKFKAEDHKELQRHLAVIMLSQGPFSSGHTFSPDQTDLSKLTPIQWRLINCNLKRRNRFLYAQLHSEALNTPSSGTNPSAETPKPEVQDLPARPIVSVPLQRPSTKSVAMATSASGITDLPAVLPVLPKGPASSHATRTNLSTTVIKLPYPRPPKMSDDAMVFQCPCCCQTLPVGTLETSRWKKHLAEDIQPYTCVLSGCPSPEVLHATKKAWESHLRDDHGSTDLWTCFACLDSLQFEAEADFLAHTLQEHGETISEGKIHALAAACKTSITAEITSCPLCAWPTFEEAEISQIAVLDHIAEHVHAFSLRALPWAPDAEHETGIGHQRAVSKVEPWLTKHNLTSKSLTIIESSTTTPVAPSPVPHYFDTHDYFAEGSEDSSCSTVSDGTIERELRKGQSPVYRKVYVESYYESDEVESDDVNLVSRRVFVESDYESDDVESDGANDGSQEEDDEDDLLISVDVKRVARKSYVADEARVRLEDIEDVDYDDEIVQRSAGAEESDVSQPIDDGEYVSRLSSWYAQQDTSFEKRSDYKLGRTISYGKYSSVYNTRDGPRKVAIKAITKNKVKDKVQEIHQQIELLQYVKHTRIIRYVDWFESKDDYYIVTDLVEGGDLCDHITEKGKLTEPNALRALNDILAALEYLHHFGIVHRHLALHKFRYLTKDKRSPLILISLAHADWEKTEARYIIPTYRRVSASKDKHFGECAPEIMRQQRSGKPADMWSIGVITYMMLAGYSPFRSENLHDLIEECTMGSIVFHERYWKDISDIAKDFIQKLLKPKPEDRLTIEEAKRHPWIKGVEEMTQTRGQLVRARWKCVVFKVQLALRIQRLRLRSEKSKGQTNFGGDFSYLVHSVRDAEMYTESCREAFQAAVFTRMAVEEVEHIGLELSQAR